MTRRGREEVGVPAAFFEKDGWRVLPLWGQVLVASRAARRAALWMPRDVPESTVAVLVAGCGAIDRCCEAGGRGREDLALIERAKTVQPPGSGQGAAVAFWYAADAAHAAESSLDFSAAETACEGSVGRALEAAESAAGLTGLQARITATSDAELIGFNCREFRVGRYDGVGREVMGRLHPVYPPEARPKAAHPMDGDPTGGAR